MNYCYGKGVQKCGLWWEAVPFSEGPLSEVSLYLLTNLDALKMVVSFLLLLFCLLVGVMSQHFLTICKSMRLSCDWVM